LNQTKNNILKKNNHPMHDAVHWHHLVHALAIVLARSMDAFGATPPSARTIIGTTLAGASIVEAVFSQLGKI
jgi:hypothetical protein